MQANTSVAAGMQSASKAMGAVNKVMSYLTYVHDFSDVCIFKMKSVLDTVTDVVSSNLHLCK